jgi:hypothetical protein
LSANSRASARAGFTPKNASETKAAPKQPQSERRTQAKVQPPAHGRPRPLAVDGPRAGRPNPDTRQTTAGRSHALPGEPPPSPRGPRTQTRAPPEPRKGSGWQQL